MQPHPFDQAIHLEPHGPDVFAGHSGPGYWNMVGPFGGITAATALNAVMRHPAALGEPVSLTVNFAHALAQGPFSATARALRTNRSTQHWTVELQQPDGAGAAQTVLTATVLMGVRRDTWGASDVPMPPVPAPELVPRLEGPAQIEWLNRYEARPLAGAIPRQWDGQLNHAGPDAASLSRLWMRDHPPRALDFCSLTALADFFFPRVFLRRASRVPAGTVSMTVYFHADGATLQSCGTGYLLGQARGQVFYKGFFDQSAVLWSQAGTPLVTSSQIVYYKE